MKNEMGFLTPIFIAGALGGYMLMSMTGCMVTVGTPAAIKAYGDAQNALITNGKASADKDTAAWRTRRHQESQETARNNAPGFLGALFGQTNGAGVAQGSGLPVEVN